MLGGKTRLYADIRGNRLKYIAGRFKKGGLEVKSFGSMEFPEEDMKDGMLANSARNASVLGSFLKQQGISTRKVLINISDPSLILRIVKVPLMPEKELKDYLHLEIGQYLPVDLSTNVYDYKVLGEVEEEGRKLLNLLLTAIPREKMENCLGLFKAAGLKPLVMDVYPNCISRLYSLDTTRDTAVVEVDETGASLVILKQGELFMFSSLQPVNTMCCEGRQGSFIASAAEEDAVFAGAVDELAGFIRTYMNFFSSRHFGKSLDRVYLLGEPTLMKGVESYFRELLQVEVRAGLPENRYMIKPEGARQGLEDNEQSQKRMLTYACNLGLMLRGV